MLHGSLTYLRSSLSILLSLLLLLSYANKLKKMSRKCRCNKLNSSRDWQMCHQGNISHLDWAGLDQGDSRHVLPLWLWHWSVKYCAHNDPVACRQRRQTFLLHERYIQQARWSTAVFSSTTLTVAQLELSIHRQVSLTLHSYKSITWIWNMILIISWNSSYHDTVPQYFL